MSEKPPMARLFVALELPQPVRDKIVVWQAAELTDPKLRPVKSAALHFTLAFLGGRPETEIEAVAAALPPGLPAPRMRLLREPVGVPRGKRPRLFAVEAEDIEGKAAEAQQAVSETLSAAGFYEPEDRPWWPHITVARVRPEVRGSRRPALLETSPEPLSTEAEHTFVSVRMQLYRSYLRPQGSEYVSLASLELNPES